MVAHREFINGRKILGAVSAAHRQPVDFLGFVNGWLRRLRTLTEADAHPSASSATEIII
jgi:hypothetical protein